MSHFLTLKPMHGILHSGVTLHGFSGTPLTFVHIATLLLHSQIPVTLPRPACEHPKAGSVLGTLEVFLNQTFIVHKSLSEGFVLLSILPHPFVLE